MKLKATRQEYEFSDASGYRFTVVADFDPGWGWSASVVMKAHGMKTAQDAIAFLENPAKHFLRQLKANPTEEGAGE